MMSGYGVGYFNTRILASPRSSVYLMAMDSLLWRIYGDFSGSSDWDRTLHQWSKDAK